MSIIRKDQNADSEYGSDKLESDKGESAEHPLQIKTTGIRRLWAG